MYVEKPHERCPNYVDEFPLETRGMPCVTCEDLGQIPGCIGAVHPRRRPSTITSGILLQEFFNNITIIMYNFGHLLLQV